MNYLGQKIELLKLKISKSKATVGTNILVSSSNTLDQPL
jgi:hypothetical protein